MFVGGLHRSGTTIVTDCLRAHPQISGFEDTGVREDEGQFLQTVYPTAGEFGGPGRWAFQAGAALDERSPLVSDANRSQLFQQWARHWDLDRPVLLEKSPPNLLRARFLQAMFPSSTFVMVMRHPVAVSYATWTRRRRNTRLRNVLEHWVVAHERFAADVPYLARLIVVPFERFVSDPETWVRSVLDLVGLEGVPKLPHIRTDTNLPYFDAWQRERARRLRGVPLRRTAARLEGRAHAFGYSLDDLTMASPHLALTPETAPRDPGSR